MLIKVLQIEQKGNIFHITIFKSEYLVALPDMNFDFV